MLRLSDAHWERIREHFPEENIPAGRVGRKPIPSRRVLEAVLWILNTGAQWHMLPQCYPNYKTVHCRFQHWCRNEVLREVMTDLANALRDEGAIDESECFIDATFASAKGGGEEIGPTKRGKGVKIMAIVDRHGLPLAVSTHAAKHHEVTLVQLSFDFYMIEAKPENLIGDRVYHLDRAHMQTLMCLMLSVAGHLTIFLTRTRGPFWSIRPAWILLLAVVGTQVMATLIAVYGVFMTPLGWGWALFVWGYALAWFFVNDRMKLLASRVFDPTAAPLLLAKTSIDVTPQIAKRAYELYERRGRGEGQAVQDWFQAESEIRKDILLK